ncbi:TPA: FAD-dependent oxidoreductase [Salmonella enterica]|nr:FAD-binding oxidoreductase [Salmonella enterica subsp. enterica]EHX1047904.1 FAD-binding oxidoreductase [Salmonella enterica subsp. enterica serovar Oranienburg]ELP2193252.1 FAD-binding oxidoreductase [Salmonella enterica subsp. enterica serovar Champaign]MLY13579.1 FAD-binding oxidoreductase [Salmonella enterica subsp. enterica serovar Oranienburg]HAF2409346.1 FAD-binding oxidoreductase [Salmonella enterica]
MGSIKADVVIVGSGISGLSAAYHATEAGLNTIAHAPSHTALPPLSYGFIMATEETSRRRAYRMGRKSLSEG